VHLYWSAYSFRVLCLKFGILNLRLSVCTLPKALKLATVVTLVSSITITCIIVTTPVITIVDTACYYHDYNISIVASVSRPSEIHASAMLLFPTVRH
jgi:hypothetical protein